MYKYCVRSIFTDREILDVCACLAELFTFLRDNNFHREFFAYLAEVILTQFTTSIFDVLSSCRADDAEDLAIEMFYICKDNILPLALRDKTYITAKILSTGAHYMFKLGEV